MALTTTPAFTAYAPVQNFFNINYVSNGVPQYVGQSSPEIVIEQTYLTYTPTANDAFNYQGFYIQVNPQCGVNLTFNGNIIGNPEATYYFSLWDPMLELSTEVISPKVSGGQTLSTFYYNDDISVAKFVAVICNSNRIEGFTYPQRIENTYFSVVGVYGYEA